MRVLVETGGGAEGALEHLGARSAEAIRQGLLRSAFMLGRQIAENVEHFKETVGTRRLARSFLVPREVAGGSFMLGEQSPVYAAIHEFGGTIKARNSPYLVFQTPDGEWHTVKEVHIREKRYARDAVESFERTGQVGRILGIELGREFHD